MGRFGNNTEFFESTHQVLVVLVVRADGLFPLVSSPILCDLIKNVNFVVGCLDVVLSALLNFERDITIEPEIFC